MEALPLTAALFSPYRCGDGARGGGVSRAEPDQHDVSAPCDGLEARLGRAGRGGLGHQHRGRGLPPPRRHSGQPGGYQLVPRGRGKLPYHLIWTPNLIYTSLSHPSVVCCRVVGSASRREAGMLSQADKVASA